MDRLIDAFGATPVASRQRQIRSGLHNVDRHAICHWPLADDR